jgi:hypothetical protein
VTKKLIGDFPAADDREQMGRFLSHAFPLGSKAFDALLSALDENEQRKGPTRH